MHEFTNKALKYKRRYIPSNTNIRWIALLNKRMYIATMEWWKPEMKLAAKFQIKPA